MPIRPNTKSFRGLGAWLIFKVLQLRDRITRRSSETEGTRAEDKKGAAGEKRPVIVSPTQAALKSMSQNTDGWT
jgi:hypothetical protein